MAEAGATPGTVELAQRPMEAVNTRNLDAFMLCFAPGAVVDLTRTAGVVNEGREAIRYQEDWLGSYDELAYSAEEIVDFGNGVTLAIVAQSARPIGTTAYVHAREGFLVVVDHGLCVHTTVYAPTEIDEARAAAERLAHERGRR
jgi:hypothetical protein